MKLPNGFEVKAARQQLKMTQNDFAKMLYLKPRQIRYIESGTTKIGCLAWEKTQMALKNGLA